MKVSIVGLHPSAFVDADFNRQSYRFHQKDSFQMKGLRTGRRKNWADSYLPNLMCATLESF